MSRSRLRPLYKAMGNMNLEYGRPGMPLLPKNQLPVTNSCSAWHCAPDSTFGIAIQFSQDVPMFSPAFLLQDEFGYGNEFGQNQNEACHSDERVEDEDNLEHEDNDESKTSSFANMLDPMDGLNAEIENVRAKIVEVQENLGSLYSTLNILLQIQGAAQYDFRNLVLSTMEANLRNRHDEVPSKSPSLPEVDDDHVDNQASPAQNPEVEESTTSSEQEDGSAASQPEDSENETPEVAYRREYLMRKRSKRYQL
jgi:hypothetical protein